MNYKKIITSQKSRFFLLRCLSWIPDKWIIPLQYRIKTDRWPNLKNPQRFTEKLQVYKMKYRNPLMHQCVDKYEVRKYVEGKGLAGILVKCYGVYKDAKEIDYVALSNQFVVKTTDGGGGNNVLICKDKNLIDWDETIKKVNSWLGVKDVNAGREWAYTGIKESRIIVEEYIPSDPDKGGLIDYKFFCFNGRCEYIYVVADRKIGHGGGFGVFSRNFEKTEVQRVDERPLERDIPKPDNYDELMATAELLAGDFPEVRVDLYDVDGKILFGELTFYDGSGYMTFNPDSFDYEMGEKFDVSSFIGN